MVQQLVCNVVFFYLCMCYFWYFEEMDMVLVNNNVLLKYYKWLVKRNWLSLVRLFMLNATYVYKCWVMTERESLRIYVPEMECFLHVSAVTSHDIVRNSEIRMYFYDEPLLLRIESVTALYRGAVIIISQGKNCKTILSIRAIWQKIQGWTKNEVIR